MSTDSIGVITSSIPLPPKRSRRSNDPLSTSALLSRLQIGDSVLLSRKVREGLFARAKSLGIKITTRVMSGETVRVWRAE
jgi:hypothetical protein